MPDASYVCQAAGTSIIGGAPSWITERQYYYEGRRLQAYSGRQKSWKLC